jgi:hypothetical protein
MVIFLGSDFSEFTFDLICLHDRSFRDQVDEPRFPVLGSFLELTPSAGYRPPYFGASAKHQ